MTTQTFGLIGMTRQELHDQQLFLDVARRHPEQIQRLVDWLSELIEGKVPAASHLPLQYTPGDLSSQGCANDSEPFR